MSHNDTVKRSFKKQAEKFGAYHMSKTEYTDYLIKRIGAKGNQIYPEAVNPGSHHISKTIKLCLTIGGYCKTGEISIGIYRNSEI